MREWLQKKQFKLGWMPLGKMAIPGGQVVVQRLRRYGEAEKKLISPGRGDPQGEFSDMRHRGGPL